jgi:8-oxo-dGTP pyrophosphatase MutT (NUDIX family)
MSGSVLRLPPTVAEWRGVIAKALQLQPAALRIPRQFVTTVKGQHTALTFAELMPSAKTNPDAAAALFAKARTSAVLVLLSPVLTGSNTMDGRGQPGPAGVVRTDENARELDARCLDASVDRGVPVAFEGLDLELPVTMRTSKMRSHADQMSFPGGRCDDGETLLDAACREADEEIGVRRGEYSLFADAAASGYTQPAASPVPTTVLPRVYSYPSKSFVHPVVALADAPVTARVASPDEVASVHSLRLSDLLLDVSRQHHRCEKTWSSIGTLRMPCFYTGDGKMFWGLSAWVLCDLLTRVATVLQLVPQQALPAATWAQWGEATPGEYLALEDAQQHPAGGDTTSYQNPYAYEDMNTRTPPANASQL